MTVAPRYAEYEDACDTGVSVPVLVPPGCRAIPELPGNAGSACSVPDILAAAANQGQEQHFAGAPQFYVEERAHSHNVAQNVPPLASLQARVQSGVAACSTAGTGELYTMGHSGALTMAVAEIGEQPGQREQHAHYYICRKADVDHVFVDHPLYCRTDDIYGSSNVNTYQEAGDFPDLDIRYSILCQAALAAPLLLWGHTQPASIQSAASQDRALDQHSAILQQGSLGQQTAAALGCPILTSTAATLESVAQGTGGCQQSAVPLLTAQAGSLEICQPPMQVLASRGPQTCDSGSSVAPRSSDGESREAKARSGAEPLIFIGNDWPCAPLALRLKYCLQQGAHAGSREHVAGDAAFLSRLSASLQHAHSAFCIHNLAYQGTMPLAAFPRLCLPSAALSALQWPPPPGGPSFGCDPSGADGTSVSDVDAAGSDVNAEEHGASSVNWMHVRSPRLTIWQVISLKVPAKSGRQIKKFL